MRAVVQRVSRASVRSNGETTGAIQRGSLVLVGVGANDQPADARWLADKVRTLRIFPKDDGVMDLSVEDVSGSVLAVSQFTLYGDARKGRRPSYIEAAEPETAERLYRVFVEHLRVAGVHVEEGRFRAHMEVELVNDGPVTILLDSTKAF